MYMLEKNTPCEIKDLLSSSYIYIYLFHTLSDQALIFADIAIYIGMLIYHREKKCRILKISDYRRMPSEKKYHQKKKKKLSILIS